MKVNNPSFIGFDGTPITGVVPPRVWVMNDVEPSVEQQAGVFHAYKLFRSNVQSMVGEYLVQNRVLPDGTRIRLESMQNQDVVYVWPAPNGGKEVKAPHGFAVATNWRSPKIYRRRLEWPVGETRWKFANDFVPQVKNENYIYDNQVFRSHGDADPTKYFNLPLVERKNRGSMWDYGPRKAYQPTSSNQVLPFKLVEAGKFDFRPPHFAAENKIYSATGDVLYTMPLADQILLPTAPEPDEPQFLAASTDSQGNQLALQHWRFAVISPTFNLWKWRFANERIRRTDATTYEVVERVVQDVIVPIGGQTVTTSYLNDAQMGEEIDDRLIANQSHGTGPGTPYYTTGWVEYPLDISAIPRRSSFDQTIRLIKDQGDGEATLTKLLAVGVQSDVGYIPLKLELNYPATVFWRGGEKATGYFKSDVYGDSYTLDRWGVDRIHIKRYDTNYDVDGTPKVTAQLGWFDLKLLEGTTTGRMSGREHIDIETRHGYFLNNIDRAYITREIPQSTDPSAPNYYRPPIGADPGTFWEWMTEHNIRNTYWETLRLEKGTVEDFSGPNPGVLTTVVHNERPVNTVGYSLVSRYVIDYDHKGQFYAAIRCEVTCSGAEWVEDIAVYKGFMKLNADPTYTVKIWFECKWGGQVGPLPDGLQGELLLVEETITRPMFEVIPVENFSPWYWPFPAYLDRSCIARTPPQPVPDENFMMQLKTLASNQGYNDNLACADVRTDFPPEDAVRVQSVEGIEYSTLKDNRVIPHERFVTGQLYARTFKLSDFYEAFWMLRQLKVSAVEDDFQPPEPAPVKPLWFYHPLIKAALDVTRHIEVRDGGIINWSDDLPGEMTGHPPAPAPRPAYNDRVIRIHRV